MKTFELTQCTLCQNPISGDRVWNSGRQYEVNCPTCGRYLITWKAAYHAIPLKRKELSDVCKKVYESGRIALVGTSSGNNLRVREIKDMDFYLVEELADKLRVNKMTIYRWIKAGKLHATKIGKEYRITRADFERLINQATKKN